MNLNWQDYLAIMGPMLAFFAWFYRLNEKHAEERFKGVDDRFKGIDERFKGIDERFKEIKEELKDIKKDTSSIKDRLTRLEGRFDERGYWEARIEFRKDESKKS